MRLNQAVGTVETEGLSETANFSIKVTGKAFKILLDGLYADKVAAVIRELSTNAYDAHLALGHGDRPFDVQIPTIWDPTFRVRDYGISMSHEQTMRLMSTIFDSTKDSSNTMVGAFGLGSKSPFSMVDTFSLTVIKDGEKRMYSAFYGPDGVPAIALLGREPTTERQGVEFQLTIDQKDIRSFKDKAQRILRWFPTHPNLYEGTVKLELPKYDALMEGKGWRLLRSDPYIGNTAYARQGCVMYPLNAGAIPNLTEAHRALMQAPLVIDFAIGSLDVAASREALSYDDPTCANISARLNSVSKEVIDHYGKAIKDAPTIWEAGRKRREISRGSGLPSTLVRVVTQTKWKDTVVPGEIEMPALLKHLKDKYSIEATPYFWDHYRAVRSDVAVYFDYNSESSGRRWEWEYGNEDLTIFFTVAGERPTYEGRRIRESIPGRHPAKGILLFIIEKEDDAKVVMEAMGTPPMGYSFTKDLAAPTIQRNGPAPKRGTTKKEEVKVRKIEKDTTGTWVYRDETVVPLDGDAYYAILQNQRVRELGPAKDKSVEPDVFLRAFTHADECGYMPSKPVYLISTVYQKRIEAFGQWKRIDEHVREAVTANFADKLFEEAETQNIQRHLSQCHWANLLTSDGRFKALADRLKVGPLYGLHNTLINFNLYSHRTPLAGNKYSAAVWPLTNLGCDTQSAVTAVQQKLQKSSKMVTLNLASNNCNTIYPLVASINGFRSSGRDPNMTTNIMQYIEAIDMLQASKAVLASARAAA